MDCLFLINPAAGRSEGGLLLEELNHCRVPGISVTAVYTDPDRLHLQVHSLSKGKDLVVAAGGDGTIHAVLGLLAEMESPPPAALIPLGTGNDLARSSGWLDVWSAGGLHLFLTVLRQAKAKGLDVWRIEAQGDGWDRESMTFVAYLGLGMDGNICRHVQEERCVGPDGRVCHRRWRLATRLAFVTGALSALLRGRGLVATLCDPMGSRKSKKVRLAQLLLANISSYAGGSLLPARGDFSDGLLECHRHGSSLGFLGSVIAGFVRGLGRSGSTGKDSVPRVEGMRIVLEEPVHLQADGEYAGLAEAGTVLELSLMRQIPFLLPPADLLARKRIIEPVHERFYAHGPLVVKTTQFDQASGEDWRGDSCHSTRRDG